MGLFDRLNRVIRANVNDLISKAEDPEKMLEQALADMQEDLVQLRQAVAKAIASQRRTQQQYETNQAEANKWQQRAQLALKKGDESLAREALQRKKNFADTANMLAPQLEQQQQQVQIIKRQLIALESKIAEAKTKKDMYKARIRAAEANKELQESLGTVGTSDALAAFERMEDKVLELEAIGQAGAELGGFAIEERFAALEAGSVDDELASLKAELAGGAAPAGALPAGDQPDVAPVSDEVVDAELEELRRQVRESDA